MEIDLALLADAATVDAAGKLNILGIFDRVHAQHLPAKHGRLSLILRFTASLQDAGSHRLQITLSGPDAAEILNIDGEMQLGPGAHVPSGPILVPHVINLDGLVFETSGVYTFDVRVDGEHHVAVPLTVVGPLGGAAQA
ncbi:MAG: hypothetical protein BMS9Abin29_1582 [Gemmatimonadota bacterium]|nr:MAG: hypothetical protein BMS9Abin29_1582 [Gemmatimonadota bacterium]